MTRARWLSWLSSVACTVSGIATLSFLAPSVAAATVDVSSLDAQLVGLRAALPTDAGLATNAGATALLDAAESLIPDVVADETAAATARRSHLAGSLARLSRYVEPRAAATARLRAVELYLAVSQGEGTARERFWAEGELAGLYLDAGRPTEALVLARRASRAAGEAGDPLAEFRFGRSLAAALEATGARDAALETRRRVAALGDALRRDRLGAAAERAGDGRRAQSSTHASAAAAVQTFDGQLGEEVRAATDALLSMLLDTVESGGAAERQPRLREVRDLLETRLRAELEDHFQDACLTSREAVALDEIEGALVLYPILLGDRVAILTGFEGEFAYHRAAITPATLREDVRSFRRLLEKRTTREYRRPAARLYDALIRPIEDRIEAEEVDTLVVAPDGPLRTIPFAALHDRTRDRFLVDLRPVATVPSLRLTQPTPIAGRALRVLAAGLEDATDGFDRLEFTRREIRGLRDRFPDARILFDDRFEIAALERELRTRPYSVVHVATHGRMSADGGESFLLASDGRLGLDRMAELIGTTRFRATTPLELLTLSACETAAGDEQAALGLAGVALRSGARSALATLWPVNDEATARLIDAFYAELGRPGQTRAGALRAAQQAIRERPRFAHPGYWAPFLMISSWL